MSEKCPSCGFQNIPGEDRCVQCLHSLMQRDLPRPKKDDAFQRVMMSDPISDLLTGEDLLVASPSDTLEKTIKIFQEKHKDCTLVYKRKKLVGIVSNRDFLWKVAVKTKDLSKVTLDQIMTTNVEYVLADAPIAYVVNKMAMGGFRHVPVLQADGAPLSIIKIMDVLEYLGKAEKQTA